MPRLYPASSAISVSFGVMILTYRRIDLSILLDGAGSKMTVFPASLKSFAATRVDLNGIQFWRRRISAFSSLSLESSIISEDR
ncbi:hypothetical protein [Mesotoga sp.]|uniref:hypothetical protein n=1 Tax=Mesotoga sp. TaxID=2053577 RepID=UPI0026037C18|nr:hypothetical protein [Mesotoga sp.]MDD4208031.1 hypothetical protein [Mesotoga sp.]